MTNYPYLSVIIPLYNEHSRLKKLARIYQFLNQQKFDYEVIVVNDGSLDNTLKKLNNLSKKFKFRLISYEKNRGKGFAIKTGMLASKGKFKLFIDIDLSTPPEETNKLLPYLSKYDLIIGSRKMSGSKLKKRQTLLRENLGKGFTILSQVILNLYISDFTCGFKCFSKKAALEIFPKQRLERWGFDSEILFLAKKRGFKIKEVPVEWSNDSESRVSFPKDLINSLIDLYRIRYNEFRRLY